MTARTNVENAGTIVLMALFLVLAKSQVAQTFGSD